MSTSGTTTYNITRDQLIAGALRLIGGISQGGTPTSAQVTEAAEALNLMVKAWEADGMPLWGLTEYQMTLTAGVSTYQLGIGKTIAIAKPLKVLQAWNRNTSSSVDIPMKVLTKQEYNALGNKTSSGNPVQFYYNPLLSYGELHVFPVPSATDASGNTINLVYQRPFEDFVATGDNPDFPQEWMEALKYGLAVRLAPEYGLPVQERQILSQEAKSIKDLALSFGVEEGSVYFGVTRRNW